MRVFVVPIAPLETVIRHRQLDEDGTSKIRGGLQAVLYDPARDGFPVAHTFDAAEFNGDRAMVRRKIVQNETRLDPSKKQSGAAVFTAGGHNHTPAKGVGYLPDPAAEVMVMRLRVRGSDRYLGGAFTTQLYDEIGASRGMRAIRRRGDRQDPADRPHPEALEGRSRRQRDGRR